MTDMLTIHNSIFVSPSLNVDKLNVNLASSTVPLRNSDNKSRRSSYVLTK